MSCYPDGAGELYNRTSKEWLDGGENNTVVYADMRPPKSQKDVMKQREVPDVHYQSNRMWPNKLGDKERTRGIIKSSR